MNDDHLPGTLEAFERARSARIAAMPKASALPDMPRQWLALEAFGHTFYFLAAESELADVRAETMSELYKSFREKQGNEPGRFLIYCERVGGQWQISSIRRVENGQK